jgi:hypothetical protein
MAGFRGDMVKYPVYTLLGMFAFGMTLYLILIERYYDVFCKKSFEKGV